MREVVPAALAGERVDRAVALLTGLSRSEVTALVEAGAVKVGGQAVLTRSRRLGEGEQLEVAVPERGDPARPAPDPSVPFSVVHRDEHLVVVDKPAGVVVHPGAGRERGTLVHGLVARFPDLATAGAGEPHRPGLVHRLDKGTSGLLVVARTPAAYASLVGQLQRRAVERRYLALVWGHVEASAGLVDAPVGSSAADRRRMAVSAEGREARTGYRVIRRFAEPARLSLVECRLETGRTHQVRVHLAAIGHPVVGDARYGGGRGGVPLARPFLHAHRLGFDHPGEHRWCTFASPLPPELETTVGGLR